VRFVDEYRDPRRARRLVERIAAVTRRPWTIMEVCGGQTHTLVRSGIDEVLPAPIELVHGPGCPVCVTPAEVIETACHLAAEPDVTLCSFGDMLRVPGAGRDLLGVRAAGGDVRVVYSPLDALGVAEREPARTVVFFAVGFETTAPATALSLLEARRRGLRNYLVLSAHVRVPPALEAILGAPDTRVQGLLAPGHVCTVQGLAEYRAVVARHRVPVVVAGFEPVDLLEGILACVTQLEDGRAELENRYPRSVRPEGNPAARAALEAVFEPVPRAWRGFGVLPGGGLGLRAAWREHDAEAVFPSAPPAADDDRCRAALVLTGRLRPDACPEFGTGCRPEHPLGAPMVSTEGACAAYWHAGRTRRPAAAAP
jgi:hydrogenase expression/formation protein HypD